MEVQVKWPQGRSITKFEKVVRTHAISLIHRTVIAIDPGTKSAGYAVFEEGKLTESGVIKVAQTLPINTRLYQIAKGSPKLPADVLIVEDIGKGAMAHVYLKFAVGAILATYPYSQVLFCPISIWKAYAKAHGIVDKNDELDAQCMGKALIQWAKELTDGV